MLSSSSSRILSLNLSRQFYRTMTSTGKWNPGLTSEQLRVLRDKGTERPNTGKYLHNKQTGIYSCANCDLPIYKSETKFDSGCGWPAFYDAIPGSLTFTRDESFGMVRIEICCSRCGGHMGHVFEGEGWQKILNLPTDQRHCVNSCSLNFKEG
ncbi:Mxr2 [Kluyveromyces lactis]|nr:Mxr2 [Kluyveromyces lactis]